MRICQIMMNKAVGGAERVFVDTSLALADRGHMVEAVVHPEFLWANKLRHDNIRLHRLPVVCRYSPLARWRLACLLAEIQPDVVHAHLRKAMSLLATTPQRLGIPLVVTLHNYGNVKRYAHADRLIALTPAHRAYLIAHGVENDRVDVIGNFTRLKPLLQPRSYQQPVRLFAMGRLIQKKGYHHLINAVALCHQQGVPVALTIAGDGPDVYALNQQIRTCGLAEHVHLKPWVSDISKAFSEFDVFVLPSTSEPFGMVLIEAMSQRLAIVSTRTEGPKDFLTEQQAWLTEPGDVQGLAEQLIKAYQAQPEQLQQKAEAGFKLYCKSFSPCSSVPRLETVYRQAQSYSGGSPVANLG
ncbi:glycosyltransferase [Neiella marina]|uniref:Glycosyltransferase n=1 Tax=Neiella holothuriorum TaxID=2870530 RepID=A0ABS7EEP7_9GAMM|nr:glycosyltransferase [Neiella holothuriorum]MBW8190694.1 glycosyltransferase [Neiella holothuriorum]